jgi:hypothetical protein
MWLKKKNRSNFIQILSQVLAGAQKANSSNCNDQLSGAAKALWEKWPQQDGKGSQ